MDGLELEDVSPEPHDGLGRNCLDSVGLLSDEEEKEFGDFLMDAVDWL